MYFIELFQMLVCPLHDIHMIKKKTTLKVLSVILIQYIYVELGDLKKSVDA